MEPGYISAVAALAGSLIGGLTSLGASWLNQHVQFKTQEFAHDVHRREVLYRDFIQEASKMYADAYEHSEAEVSKLVNLYALIGQMRVRSSPKIVAAADDVLRLIVETYLAPNRTFKEITKMLGNQAMDPLREFGEACREELRGLIS
jgi:hypothetical protein